MGVFLEVKNPIQIPRFSESRTTQPTHTNADMAQGGKKLSNARPGAIKKSGNSAKAVKAVKRDQKARKGNPTQAPKGRRRDDDTLDDMALSKAIDKSNEAKMSAKALQSGNRVGMKDLLAGGKELNREARRKVVKARVGRVEGKLKELEAKAEAEGLL